MRHDLTRYRDLLRRYHTMIFGEVWHDGRREKLVQEMDPVWARLSELERKQAVEVHARQMYEERLNHGKASEAPTGESPSHDQAR